MVMQILTLIVQNAFPNRIVGTATAASNYFRQVGATLGSAIVGSVFASRLTTLILEKLAGGAGSGGDLNAFTPASVNALPDALRLPIVESYNEALMPIFIFMVPLALISAVALAFLKPKALAGQRPGRRGRRRPRRGAAAPDRLRTGAAGDHGPGRDQRLRPMTS